MKKLYILFFFSFFSTIQVDAQDYCRSTSSAPWEEWIAGVQIGDLDNPSGKFKQFNSAGYSDYTNLVATITERNPSIRLVPGFSSAFANLGWRVWIDFNQNGTFEANESVLAQQRGIEVVNERIQIPDNALRGNTRMRVIGSQAFVSSGACGVFPRGEVEDYTINIDIGGTGTQQPDLVLQNFPRPINLTAGQINRFNLEIANLGTADAAGDFEIRFWLSNNSTLSNDDTKVGEIFTGNLGQGVFPTTAAVDIPARFADGNYYFIAEVDATNTITESNESNNQVAIFVNVSGSGGADCPMGDIILRSQAEVNAFPANCTRIEGDFRISGEDITDLSPLNNITYVSGSMDIGGNPSLIVMDDLNNLVEVGGDLYIIDNQELTTVSGLSKLTTVGEQLMISCSTALINIDGLSNLESVKTFAVNASLSLPRLADFCKLRTLENLDINDVEGLISIEGLKNLETVSNEFKIESCPNLTTFDGLENLNSVGGDFVIGDGLADISALSNLTSIGGNFSANFTSLANFSGLDNLQRIGGRFGLYNNTVLRNLEGLNNLQFLEGNRLYLQRNENLMSLNGLENVESYLFEIRITENPELSDYCALRPLLTNNLGPNTVNIQDNAYNPTINQIRNSVTCAEGIGDCPLSGGTIVLTSQAQVNSFPRGCVDIEGTLHINGGDITDLSPLNHIRTISGSLLIFHNSNLTDLNGLNALEEVGYNVKVHDNTSLTTISGLRSLRRMGNQLGIFSNRVLRDLSGLQSLEYLWEIFLSDCHLLQNLPNFCEFERIGQIVLRRLPNITNLEMLKNIEVVTNDFTIWDMNGLANVRGLEKLNTVNGSLYIGGDSPSNIDDLSALANLTRIGWNFIIQHTLLRDLSGLESLNYIRYRFTAISNPNLVTLDGLQNTRPEQFIIRDNVQLTNFCALRTAAANLEARDVLVAGNAYNPTVEQIANTGECRLLDGANICMGDVFLQNQAQIDTFSQQCTDIEGDLVIHGDDITDLSPLNHIRTIGGNLDIFSNESLTDLNGLNALESIRYNVRIYDNTNLTSISGLGNLKQVGSQLSIFNHLLLEEISGLNNLEELEELFFSDCRALTNLPNFCKIRQLEQLTLQYLPVLTSIEGLKNVEEITENVTFLDVTNLSSFAGLESLQRIGGNFAFNSQTPTMLSDITALSNLTTIEGSFRIQATALRDFSGLENLRSVERDFTISSNPALVSLDGLQNLELDISSLSIISNPSLVNYCALIPVFNRALPGWVIVRNNAYNPSLEQIRSISDCDGDRQGGGPDCPIGDVELNSQAEVNGFLSTCDTIFGDLIISGADITDLSPLNMLVHIEGGLAIERNPNLRNINTFDNLKRVNSGIGIQFNDRLETVNSFQNLLDVSGIVIANNNALEHINGFDNLTNLNGVRFGGQSLLSLPVFDKINNLARITITETEQLQALTSFPNLDTLSSLALIGNSQLRHIDGLSNLKHITSIVDIQENEQLDNLTGLSNVEYIGASLTIRNTGISHLELNSLHTIGSVFTLSDNPNLESLEGLEALKLVNSTGIFIRNNASLTTLNGIQNIEYVIGRIAVENNIILTDFCALKPVLQRDAIGFLFIQNNAYNPTEAQILSDSQCRQSGDGDDCPVGDVSLTTQAEVDAFPIGCVNIEGNLHINGNDITDLSPLNEIQSISGNLEIFNNGSLTDLNGLTALEEVGFNIKINNNNSLTSVSGLTNLKKVGQLAVFNNGVLRDMSALSNIEEIKEIFFNDCAMLVSLPDFSRIQQLEHLTLQRLSSLTNLESFRRLVIVTGNLFLFDMPNLEDLSGFERLGRVDGRFEMLNLSSLKNLRVLSIMTSVGSLRIQNTALATLEGLRYLGEIKFDLTISSNPNLVTIAGSQRLFSIGSSISIFSNPKLISLQSLINSRLDTSVRLSIQNNAVLTDFCDLTPVFRRNVPTNVNITGNAYNPTVAQILSNIQCDPSNSDENGCPFGDVVLDSQIEVDIFPATCTHIEGNLMIQGTDIVNLDALNHLEVIDGDFRLEYRTRLTTIDGFNNLHTVGGQIRVSGNQIMNTISGFNALETANRLTIYPSAVEEISGFQNLEQVVGDFSISGGANLSSAIGFRKLTEVGSLGFTVVQNDFNFEGFENLERVYGTFSVNNSNGITTLDGFRGLKQVDGDFEIVNNPLLRNLDGLSNLEQVDGASFTILNNAALNNYCGLSNLFQNDSDVGTLNIERNLYNPTPAEIADVNTCQFDNSGQLGIDLELSISTDNPNIRQWQRGTFTYMLENKGPEDATGVKVDIRFRRGYAVEVGGTSSITSSGFVSTGTWREVVVPAGGTATVEVEVFSKVPQLQLYAQVLEADQTDFDSTPDNGACCTANEDDEAVFVSGAGGNLLIDQPAISSTEIDIFPNPAKDKANLQWVLPEAGELRIDILNLRGQVLQTHTTWQEKGFVQQQLSLAHLSTGVYLVHIQSNEQFLTKKLIIQ